MKAVKMQGIFVGSRRMFEDMNRLICQHTLKPVVDKIFAFEETQKAFEYMESGSHFGKIVIKIS
jgi:NADPH:quinone reductase-like Zn-dependent oxidoreductase